MPFQLWIIIDACVAVLILGIVNSILFETTLLFIVPPLLVIVIVVTMWLIRKYHLRKWWWAEAVGTSAGQSAPACT